MDNSSKRKPRESDGDILWAIKGVIEWHFPNLGMKVEQLKQQCSARDQSRIATHPEYERGTIERWAWHAGYVTCLGSILHLIDKRLAESRRRDDQERELH